MTDELITELEDLASEWEQTTARFAAAETIEEVYQKNAVELRQLLERFEGEVGTDEAPESGEEQLTPSTFDAVRTGDWEYSTRPGWLIKRPDSEAADEEGENPFRGIFTDKMKAKIDESAEATLKRIAEETTGTHPEELLLGVGDEPTKDDDLTEIGGVGDSVAAKLRNSGLRISRRYETTHSKNSQTSMESGTHWLPGSRRTSAIRR